MNLHKNQSLHPHLRDEEALVVENAIRLAIDSILNVLYGVNSARSHELKRTVAERDKEIQRLTEVEHELKVLRRQGCTCGMFGSQPAGDPHGGFEPSCMDSEMTAGQQECDMSISLGLFARPPSHVSSQSYESALPSSPSRMGLDQSCISHSSESSGLSEAARDLPTSPSSLVIKEEPCDMDTVFIKWEMSEERFGEHQESTGSPCQDKESPSVKKNLENMERRTEQEKPHSDPGGYYNPHGEHLRNKKKGVPMSEMTEEAQRLKRAAWRAASRRYYARKVARQQANPSRSGPIPLPSRSGPFPSRSGPFPSRSGPFPSRSGAQDPSPHAQDPSPHAQDPSRRAQDPSRRTQDPSRRTQDPSPRAPAPSPTLQTPGAKWRVISCMSHT
ncbi:uncharacterized protein LOC129109346 [Anoplopoma fimbria]|uniref:uncharacterized protein LOC129109346 n=1 Tax=Anoplopoma fimbria TaxID=229290 RepID=UPI0023EB3DDB|nr:uncharacterized protein LOC129109346 [Anoplopoma fimbria]